MEELKEKRAADQKALRKSYAKKGLCTGIYFAAAALIEIVTFGVLGFGGIPQYWWLDLAALIVLAVVVLIVPGMFAQNIVASLLLLLQVVVSVANEVLYHMSDMIFTLSLLGVANEGGKVFTVSMFNFKFIAGLSAIFIATVAALFFCRKEQEENRNFSLCAGFRYACGYILNSGLLHFIIKMCPRL